MKPWVIESNQQFRPAGPYAVNSNEYTADFNEVKSKGARVGSTRTAEEEKIGKFWSENRPSFIWNNIVRKAIENKKLDAWKTARLFALMHVSMAESISSQLNAGYHFYFWRPETAIRLAATDGNDNTTGRSYLVTFSFRNANFCYAACARLSQRVCSFWRYDSRDIAVILWYRSNLNRYYNYQYQPCCNSSLSLPFISQAFHKQREIIH
jgi:hypothetical protein